MPDALSIVLEVRRRTPSVKVVAITLGETESVGAMALGRENEGKEEHSPIHALTPREVESLQLVDQGMSKYRQGGFIIKLEA